jgi:spermidine/putrescine transport system permease protein
VTTAVAPPPAGRLRRGVLRLTPYILLVPGLLWLLVFFVVPMIQMFTYSVATGSLDTGGFRLVWTPENYAAGIARYGRQFVNSIIFGGLATLLTLAIGFPVAYTIAFRGGRFKNLLLFVVIAPFFTSFLIRTISWKILLGDEGPVLAPLKHVLNIVPGDFSIIFTPVSQLAGLTYNFLPFMILPLYVALEKIDPRLIEAAQDLYASNVGAFRRVTLPLALPGVFAGTLLTFIPAMGDYVNAELLGNPRTQMIGNVIQDRLIIQGDYPVGSALSFVLMVGIVLAVAVYARLLGTEQLTG